MPSSRVSLLEGHLGYWLRCVSNHVSHAFKTKVESRGVTVAEWVVMRALFDSEGGNPSQLAERIGLTRGAVSKLIDRLASKRLVSSRVEKADRRYQTVSLTEAGRRLVPALASLADRNDEEFFDVLSDVERAELRRLLEKVVRHHGLKSVPVD